MQTGIVQPSYFYNVYQSVWLVDLSNANAIATTELTTASLVAQTHGLLVDGKFYFGCADPAETTGIVIFIVFFFILVFLYFAQATFASRMVALSHYLPRLTASQKN